MQARSVVSSIFAVLLARGLPLVAGHGGDGPMHMEMGMAEAANATVALMPDEFEPNYFRHSEAAGWMYAHIALMILSWVFVLPPALMLSIARSRYHLPAQVVFHIVNALGVFTGVVYNHSTPDLYVSNSHHPIGWVVTSLTIAWTAFSLVSAYAAYKTRRDPSDSELAVSHENIAQYDQFQQYMDSPVDYRHSRDSGNFSSGSRANSLHSSSDKEEESEIPLHDDENNGFDDDAEQRGFLGNVKVDRLLSRSVARLCGARISRAFGLGQIVLEKLLLLLGFLAITSGFIVYGGMFRKREVFSGLAHYAKGGIFFWYGLLTLGRWMGAFSELGWAWNIRPRYSAVSRWTANIPSAEFTESFVIWLYGATNVFLEHLNNWGGTWSPQDFEHVSITILFFGGGLLGMLLESRWMRNMSNVTMEFQKSKDDTEVHSARPFTDASDATRLKAHLWEQPTTYTIPMNPMPALVIMLLGMMMSSHHQNSMVSTMMHSQWGMLFSGFALARGVTCIMLYVKPPTSHFASRPPTELVAAFCLIAGGIMFMNSAHDIVGAIEYNGLDAMTIFTITTGLTGVLMAWEIVCFAIKGWAVRKEMGAVGLPLA